MIAESSIKQVKELATIEQTVEYFHVDTKWQGSKLKTACCPFHREKTASFYLYIKTNSFKCFGCGASGDPIKFVMLHEKANFIDSIRILANIFNVTLEGITKPELLSRNLSGLSETDFFAKMSDTISDIDKGLESLYSRVEKSNDERLINAYNKQSYFFEAFKELLHRHNVLYEKCNSIEAQKINLLEGIRQIETDHFNRPVFTGTKYVENPIIKYLNETYTNRKKE